MNYNARYDRPTNFLALEVNVPRAIGILRDDECHSGTPLHTILQSILNKPLAAIGRMRFSIVINNYLFSCRS